MVNVLFVCLGNICRSPTAHGVFEQMVAETDLQHLIHIDSCGTGSWHVGQPPDERTQQAAQKRGYSLQHLRARRLAAEDFHHFDYILAMDTRNLADVIKKAPVSFSGHIGLFLDFASDQTATEVPDPYYGGDEGFDRVFNLIENACQGLLDELRQKYG